MRAELPGSPSLSLASASCPADLISEAVAFAASLKIANGLLGLFGVVLAAVGVIQFNRVSLRN